MTVDLERPFQPRWGQAFIIRRSILGVTALRSPLLGITALRSSTLAARALLCLSLSSLACTPGLGAPERERAPDREPEPTAAAAAPITFLPPLKLHGAPAKNDTFFGGPVAVSLDTIAVGAPGPPMTPAPSGAVYVFERSGPTWSEPQRLVALSAKPSPSFGRAIALSGATLLVGAGGEDGTSSSPAQLFVRSGAGWVADQEIAPAHGQPDDHFGRAVALDGDTALVAAPSGFGFGAPGVVYVFTRKGQTWAQDGELETTSGSAGDAFGLSVGLSGDIAVVGAPNDDMNRGAAYVFVRNAGKWTQEQKLWATDGAPGDRFGANVAVSGSTAVVVANHAPGASLPSAGYAYVFERSGQLWGKTQRIDADDQTLTSIAAVSMSDGWLGLGVQHEYTAGATAGAVWLYSRSGIGWERESLLFANNGGLGDLFGTFVAVSDRYVVAGAPGDDEQGSQSGAAHVFRRERPDGSACIDAVDCESGWCVGGLCCNEVCDGPNVACSVAKKGAGDDGVCGPILQGIGGSGGVGGSGGNGTGGRGGSGGTASGGASSRSEETSYYGCTVGSGSSGSPLTIAPLAFAWLAVTACLRRRATATAASTKRC